MGEEAETPPPRRRRPQVDEEVRMLGYVRRSNKPIYDMLQKEAEARGKRPSELLEEAISHYLTERRLLQSQMTVAELYEALTFLSELQGLVLRNLMETWKLYFSEEHTGLLEIMKTLYPPEQPTTIEEKGLIIEQRKVPPEEARKLKEKIVNMMEPFLDWAIELFQKSMVEVMSKMMPGIPSPKIPEATVPVTVTVEPKEEHQPVVIKVPQEKRKAKEVKSEGETENATVQGNE